MHSLRADTDFFFVEGNNNLPLSMFETQIPGSVACSLVERQPTRATVFLVVKLHTACAQTSACYSNVYGVTCPLLDATLLLHAT